MSRHSRLVILDGPDRTGKSNIAQALCDHIGFSYFKNRAEHSSFKDNPSYFKNCLVYGVPYQISLLEQVPCDIVFDRHYPTEWVYSSVFARETNAAILDVVDSAFAHMDAAIIICRRQRYDDLYDDLFPDTLDPGSLSYIDAGYVRFMDWTKCKTLELFVDDEDLDREIDMISEFLKTMWDL